VAADKLAGGLKTEYDIQAPDVHTQARKLSGGNLQKLILARELSSTPRLVVAMQPTRGLDVGAIESVQQLLLNQRSQGCGILLVSEDLDELLSLSDRIAVMYEGHVVGVICSQDFDITQIGLMMTGTLPQDLPGKANAEETPPEGSPSSFDEVLENLRQHEEATLAELPAAMETTSEIGEQIEVPPQPEPPAPPEELPLNLTEKERVLRKVLGEKYKQGDEE